ncbi:hypothetical protein EVAR_76772_1 [Eumeta japonica]|uniref:Uncharacterized protein n=1 Tax=Eumeta variegata TaxID=151549 RepID=A0A4C1SVS9_EUMVA|nr:hypothetical protein EVAR_76772_1 [Eumeta japonica]
MPNLRASLMTARGCESEAIGRALSLGGGSQHDARPSPVSKTIFLRSRFKPSGYCLIDGDHRVITTSGLAGGSEPCHHTSDHVGIKVTPQTCIR